MQSTVSEADALFELPLSEFTAARNALAAQLKKSGNEVEAERVRGLAKPPVSAWTVNQLYWRHREAFDRLITASERFRRAQAAQLAGQSTNIRDPLAAHREALAELARHAATTLREAGHLATPEMMRRVTTTLEALATYSGLPDAPTAGRLTGDLDPPGFDTLAALVPRAGKIMRAGQHSNRVLAFQRQKRDEKALKGDPEERQRQLERERKEQRAAAKVTVQEAERAVREARKAAEQAEAALKKAATRAKETDKEKREAEQRIEKIVAAAEAAKQEARKVAAEAETATQIVDEAERALEKAKEEFEKLV